MTIVIRIFSGGKHSAQTAAMDGAMRDLQAEGFFTKESVEIQKISLKEIRDLGWPSEKFISWGRGDDLPVGSKVIFIMQCHPLQLDDPPDWDHIQHLANMRAGFQGCNVFPPSEAISGAFAQDKWDLFERLSDIMNPTFKIDRPAVGKPLLDKATAIELYKFLTKNYEIHEDNSIGGFYVKAGFCTGGKGNGHCGKVSEVIDVAMSIFQRENFERKPYVIITPTLTHNKEIKVQIFSNPHNADSEDVVYVVPDSKGNGPTFRSENFFEFVKYAKARYIQAFGPHSAYPMIRVDVFLKQNGQFVVNEFEHFEALGESGAMEIGFLKSFWVDQIKFMLARV